MNELRKPNGKACSDRLIGKPSFIASRRVSTEFRPQSFVPIPEGLRGERRTARGISHPERMHP